MIKLSYSPEWYWIVSGVLIAGGILYWSYRSAPGSASRAQRSFLVGLRFVTLMILIFCLLGPKWVEEVRHYPPGEVAVLLDASKSMEIPEEERRRIDAAKDWIGNKLEVPSAFKVNLYGFGTNLLAFDTASEISATQEGTSIAESLEALRTQGNEGQLASVVLLSDGRDHSGQSLKSIAEEFKRMEVPIHTVPIGSSSAPADIVIKDVVAQRGIRHQKPVKAEVTLGSAGFEGTRIPIRVFHDGSPVAMKDIEVQGGRQVVELEWMHEDMGFEEFLVKVPPQEGEEQRTNNELRFGVTVVDKTVDVIYMEASGSYNGELAPTTTEYDKPQPIYLKQALDAVPDIEVKALYSKQIGQPGPDVGEVAFVDSETGDPVFRIQHPRQGFPHSIEELRKYDVIINSDIPKERFTDKQLELMERFVLEDAGGFLMIGGITAFGSGGYDETVVDRVIPVAMEQEHDTQTSTFKPQIPSSAWDHPIMQLSDDASKNRKIWTEKFPKLHGFNEVDRPKPGAEVLLEHPNQNSSHGPYVILAIQEIGKGRSMAFTPDTTFYWGELFQTIWGEKIDPNKPLNEANCDSRYYQQFWANAMRWLGAEKVREEGLPVRVELGTTLIGEGQSVPVTVGLTDRPASGNRGRVVTVEVRHGQKIAQTLKPEFDPDVGEFQGEIGPLEPGTYRVRARVSDLDRESHDEKLLICQKRAQSEMNDLRADPKTLSMISNESGGKTLSSKESDSGKLRAALAGTAPVITETKEHPLWDQWIWFAVIVVLLSVEWIYRRIKGLA